MREIIDIGEKIYNLSKPKEFKRMIVFLFRAMINYQKIKDLLEFFKETPLRIRLLSHIPFFIEQSTRTFFYRNSKFQERCNIIKNHFLFLESKYNENLIRCYIDSKLILWNDEYKSKELDIIIKFEPGQKKEGLMSVVLRLQEKDIYQMIFWIDKSDDNYLYIGAMQGTNDENANEIIKGLTKHCYGYRTKNLILFATRCVAKTLGIQKIYAVSNKGYYANNHIRLDRKLKTSLDDFWEEAGGKITADYRFYELPVEEYRKSIEEIKTHKRNLYRKRFELLDSIEEAIKENLLEVMNK